MFKGTKRKYLFFAIFAVNSILIYFILLKLRILMLGWDTVFHLNRIEELSQSIRNGHLFASSGTYAFSHVGQANNIFYPYLFLYPFAVARLIFNPINAYNTVLLLSTFCSFLISYHCIRIVVKQYNHTLSENIGFWFSIIYNNSSYLVLQPTNRGDIAEYVALILLPAVFCGFEYLAINRTYLWLFLPFGLSLVAYSHFLSVCIFSFFLAFLLLVYYKRINKLVIVRLFFSVLIFVLCVLPLVIPIYRLKNRTNILLPAISKSLFISALTPSDLFLNSLNNQVPLNVHGTNVGFIILMITIFSICKVVCNDQSMDEVLRKKGILFLSIGITFCFFSTNLFPWFLFNGTPLRIIQFPWRFLGPATFCLAYSGSIFIQHLAVNKIVRSLFIAGTMFLSVVYVYSYVSMSKAYCHDYEIKKYKDISANSKNGDYMSIGELNNIHQQYAWNKKKAIYNNIVNVNGKSIHLNSDRIKFSYNKVTYHITNLRKGENIVKLPLNNYGFNHTNYGTIEADHIGNTVVRFYSNNSTKNITIKLNN